MRAHFHHRSSAIAGAWCLGAVLLTCSRNSPADDQAPAVEPEHLAALNLRLPRDEHVAYSGVMPGTGGAGVVAAPVYVAPNVVVAAAEVLANGMVIAGQRAHQQTKLREAADAVLEPYKTYLDQFSGTELLRKALDGMDYDGRKTAIAWDAKADGGLVVEAVPAFLMTQDSRALLIIDTIIIRPANQKAPLLYKNTVEVVATPLGDSVDDIQNYWTRDDAQRLMATSVMLLRESLVLALRDFHGELPKSTEPQRTVHFREGELEQMERSQVLEGDGQRLLLRNLRGWLMSVPVAGVPTAPVVQSVKPDSALADAPKSAEP
jgi:hypothetical protein